MRRYAPLARKTPLRSASKLKRGGALARSPMKRRPRKARPGLDDARYLRFVRALPCCAPRRIDGFGWSGCYGIVEAHHLTGAGLSRKANDNETVPLCSKHHKNLHEFTGPFRDMTREQRRDWQLNQIRRVRALYASTQAA